MLRLWVHRRNPLCASLPLAAKSISVLFPSVLSPTVAVRIPLGEILSVSRLITLSDITLFVTPVKCPVWFRTRIKFSLLKCITLLALH